MAKLITLNNIEKLVFEDVQLRNKLTNRKHLFHTWALSKQSPDLKPLGQQAMLDLLNTISDVEITLISQHIGEPVSVEKMSTNVVEHYNCLLDHAEKTLNEQAVFKQAFFVYRDGEQIYLSVWH